MGNQKEAEAAFSLIVASLRLWARHYPQARQWRILSAGEAFAPIDLGSGCTLHSVGKLSIEAYADLLCRTAVGFSLMVSPHPSYPPLEMAAFGARVVVNRFANKDLSGVSPLLVSASPPNPEGFSAALRTLTQAFDHGETSCMPANASEMVWQGGFLDSCGPGFAWAADVAAKLLGDAPAIPATV